MEESDDNTIKKSQEVSHILGNIFDRLKEFIIKRDADEIEFFKEIKPRLLWKTRSKCPFKNGGKSPLKVVTVKWSKVVCSDRGSKRCDFTRVKQPFF